MKNRLQPDFYYKYYIYASGVKGAVETFHFSLDAKIEEDSLRDAVKALIRRVPWLSLKPYITKDGRLAACADDRGIPVYPEDGRQRSPGSADTEGYLFAVSFRGHELFIRIGHSLSDGRGMILLCQSLLWYYLENRYGKIRDEGLLLSRDEEPKEKELMALDPFAEAFAGEWTPQERPEDVLEIAGDREYLGEQKNKNIVLKTDLRRMKEVVKGFGTTPAVFLSAVLFEAVHNHRPLKSGNVNLLLPVDLREALGVGSVLNFCGSMQIDDALTAGGSFEKELVHVKAQVERKRQREFQLGSFRALTALSALFDGVDLRDAEAFDRQRLKNSLAGKGRCTLLFTNVGKIYFPKDIAAHITAFRTYPVNTDYFPMLAMDTEGEESRLILTQSSEDESFAAALAEAMTAHGLEPSGQEKYYTGCTNVDPRTFERR